MPEYPGDPFGEIRAAFEAEDNKGPRVEKMTLWRGQLLKLLSLYEAVKESKNEAVRDYFRLKGGEPAAIVLTFPESTPGGATP
jgi:hypothetical protein